MPPAVVKIPGVGNVQFPETMSQTDIDTASKKLYDDANPSGLSQAASGIGNTLLGGLKGVGSTFSNIASSDKGGDSSFLAAKIGMSPDRIAAADQDAQHFKNDTLQPKGTAQKLGYFGEKAGEYLLPGGAEKELSAALAEHAPAMLSKALAGAGTTSLVNAAQGGSPGEVAVAGGLGALGGVSKAMQAAKAAKDAQIEVAPARQILKEELSDARGSNAMDSFSKRMTDPKLIDNLSSIGDVLPKGNVKLTPKQASELIDKLSDISDKIDPYYQDHIDDVVGKITDELQSQIDGMSKAGSKSKDLFELIKNNPKTALSLAGGIGGEMRGHDLESTLKGAALGAAPYAAKLAVSPGGKALALSALRGRKELFTSGESDK